MIKLDPEDKKLWLEGLRNSDKTRGCLKDESGMCCLGVLADRVLITKKPEILGWQQEVLEWDVESLIPSGNSLDYPHEYHYTGNLVGEILRVNFPEIEKVLSQKICYGKCTSEESDFLRSYGISEQDTEILRSCFFILGGDGLCSAILEDILTAINDNEDTFDTIIEFIERFL